MTDTLVNGRTGKITLTGRGALVPSPHRRAFGVVEHKELRLSELVAEHIVARTALLLRVAEQQRSPRATIDRLEPAVRSFPGRIAFCLWSGPGRS